MKRILAQGIAHLSFPGGGSFLPARNPYDRQLLTEHVLHRVRASGQAQVLVNDQRWMVYVNLNGEALRCSVCGSRSDVACYSPSTDDVSFCATCAFSDRVRAPLRSSASAEGEAMKLPLRTRQVVFDAATPRRGPRHSRRFIGSLVKVG